MTHFLSDANAYVIDALWDNTNSKWTDRAGGDSSIKKTDLANPTSCDGTNAQLTVVFGSTNTYNCVIKGTTGMLACTSTTVAAPKIGETF